MIVLVLEDDPLISMVIEDLVSGAAQAVVVSSRTAAREAINRHVDMAILDVDVTNGQTFDIAVLLQEKAVPFIFVSGSNPDKVPPELRHVPFFPKPFDGKTIEQQIARVVATRK
jgi:DNA-binding response OmpR family regulator